MRNLQSQLIFIPFSQFGRNKLGDKRDGNIIKALGTEGDNHVGELFGG